MHTQERRALDRWARNEGYASFDTYITAGGSYTAARNDLEQRIAGLTVALHALTSYRAAPDRIERATSSRSRMEDALCELESDHSGDEPVDTGNAHAQGDDHAEG